MARLLLSTERIAETLARVFNCWNCESFTAAVERLAKESLWRSFCPFVRCPRRWGKRHPASWQGIAGLFGKFIGRPSDHCFRSIRLDVGRVNQRVK